MSLLTDLRAALDAVDAARKTLAKPLPLNEMAYLERERALYSALRTYYKLATDDTIAALVVVAEAADTFCVCERGGEPISRLSMEAALAPLVKEANHDRA